MAARTQPARRRHAALALLLLAAWAPTSLAESDDWRARLDAVAAQRDALATTLAEAHARVARAVAGRQGLLDRLSPTPPEPRRVGWGTLPELRDDAPAKPVALQRRWYSMDWLEERVATALEDARAHAGAVPGPGAKSADDGLAALVEEHGRLRALLEQVEDHLAHHRQWQAAAREWPGGHARTARLAARLELARGAQRRGEASRAETLRREVAGELAPVAPPEGQRIELRNGMRVLPLTLLTDIGDEAFLARFAEIAHEHFTASDAARAEAFALQLSIRHVAPSALERETPLTPGEAIDVTRHLASFPEGALVLTTGGESTHAFEGRAIVLGAEPVNERVLAHELAHVIGFRDAYLRSVEGDVNGDAPLTFVEWSGITDDLMGAPAHGEVTRDMIRRLIAAHEARRPHGP